MKAMDTIQTIYGPGTLIAQFEVSGEFLVSYWWEDLKTPVGGNPHTIKKIGEHLTRGKKKIINLEIKPGEIIQEEVK